MYLEVLVIAEYLFFFFLFFFLFFFFFSFFFPQIVKMWSSHYHAINMTMVPRTVCHIHHRIEIKQSDSALSPQFELNMKFINLKNIIKKNKTDTSTGEIEV